MKKKEFNITIDAPRETVWKILWDDKTYPEWAAVFSEGSRAETDWQEGSKVLFVNAEGDGMVSRIKRSIPNEYLSFEHLGETRNGVEDLDSDKVREWSGSSENYTLKMVDGKTEVTVELDIPEEHLEFFTETWPK